MRTHSRATPVAFRRAVGASVALHVVAALGLFFLTRAGDERPRPTSRRIDTRAVHIQMSLTETDAAADTVPAPESVEPPPSAPPVAPAPEPPNTPPATAEPPPAPAPAAPPDSPPDGPAGPFAATAPRTLPPELTSLLRRPVAASPGPTRIDPNVKPAAMTGPPTGASAGQALHGAFKPEQTVVYLLDASGSMGAAGKFAAARAALAATLAGQPPGVRFQVVVYDGTARPLLPVGVTAPAATAENARAVAAALAAVEPRGKSNHAAGLRAALELRPDVVVWLTDADDLSAAGLRPVLRAAGRPVPVCVGLVTAAGVQQPRELK